MSEFTNKRFGQNELRWHLWASACMAALASSGSASLADETNRPVVWIELGGQLERLNNSQQAFSPLFIGSVTQPSLLSALNVQDSSGSSVGGEGKIVLQPSRDDWSFSASVRYGRSNANRHRHAQIKNALQPMHVSLDGAEYGPKYYYPTGHVKFSDATMKQSETHVVLDFMAGKDVGLGIFGERGSYTVSAGVRFAQFASKTDVGLRVEPDVRYPTKPITSLAGVHAKYPTPIHFHDYAGAATTERSFRGVGPSIAWNASTPVMGNPDGAEVSFDWGANAAILFGRQKVRGHHQTTTRTYHVSQWVGQGSVRGYQIGYFGTHAGNVGPSAQHTNAASFNRSRTVVVPNLGGFAGVSFLYSNAKVSFGYRADFFFGATDGGLDSRKSENVGFHGPFATISVGIGG